MQKEKELEIEGGRLYYRISEEGAAITSCRITGSRIVLPDRIEEQPLTVIGRKAFLSCKQLKEIRLPEGLRRIDDWAFAYCSHLAYVWLPKHNLLMGKGVFKECEALAGIFPLDADTPEQMQRGMLLGSVPVKLEVEYLFAPGEMEGETWLARYDERLRLFLHQPDEDGYTKMVYCGEEDIMANLDLYLEERRRAKARLCFLRLNNPVGLKQELREELRQYLRDHTKGCESEAAWEVVFREHGSEREYYAAFTEAGCLTDENYDGVLSEMGEQYPEMKGYLMRYHSQNRKAIDFFDTLSLD